MIRESFQNAIVLLMAKQQQQQQQRPVSVTRRASGDFILKTAAATNANANARFSNNLVLWDHLSASATAAIATVMGDATESRNNSNQIASGQRRRRRLQKTKSLQTTRSSSSSSSRGTGGARLLQSGGGGGRGRPLLERQLGQRRLLIHSASVIFEGPNNTPIISSPFAQFVFDDDDDYSDEDERETELWKDCQNICVD